MARARTLAYVGALGRAVRLATRAGGPSLGDRAVAVPRMVKAVRSGEYTGISLGKVALIGAGAAYVVSPIDLLPEAALGVFGLADDAMVLGWVATTLVEETEKFLEWEKTQGRGPAASPTVPSDVVR
ncbi:DUF1232 domain-containing protein [Phycicoccus sp. HDW14]|uniref:YkvA family protein n=1 Tax=Phycicoccus sp. HDW14 TaxID=2714941 RepID=UPI00140DCB9D|nr:YkvA family protein [Phycicoccus sp. HDW14]QIM20633.1 DUF1232 domain-containing protein [Phycicoccus sp. HDW14]